MKVVLFIAFLAATAVAIAPRKVLNQRDYSPDGWSVIGRAHPNQEQKFFIALRQQNLDLLNDFHSRVSNPLHRDYGQYLSIDAIMNIIGTPEHEVNAVINWLTTNGVKKTNIVNHRDSLEVKSTVGVVEELLFTKLYNFVHTEGRVVTRHLGAFSIPSDLSSVIVLTTGIADFPPVTKKGLKVTADGQTTDAAIIPYSIWKLYNFPEGFGITTNSSQCVAEFQGDRSYNKNDLKDFYQAVGVPAQAEPTVVGTYSGAYPDVEATLDFQYVTAVGLGAVNWYWTESNWMYDYTQHLFNADPAPLVTSISWGYSEADQCNIDQDCNSLGVDSATYVSRTNTEFQKIGTRGLTVTVSSGDSGVNGRTDPFCTLNYFKPDYPAACPYITSIGATQVAATATSTTVEPYCSTQACTTAGTECAVSQSVSGFTSGGGFSNVAPTPDWQKDAVADYLKNGPSMPPASYYNSTGRGYPDISAVGHNYVIYVNGRSMYVGGTSASSPTIAGIFALLNDHQMKKGKPALGFINPLLYQMAKDHPAAFNDVSCGSNACTEDGCAAKCKGFTAGAGWDPVTGLGTPNLTEMFNYLDSLDEKRALMFGTD